VQSASSRLGVKGSEKLGNGLSAIYKMEFGVDMADEATGDKKGSFQARNQFVGLTGGFGTLVAGRHDTPMKLAIAKYDLFGDQIGDNGNLTMYNFRAPNVVAYMLPKMGGFNGAVAYVADYNGNFKNGNNADNNDNQAYNVQLGYAHKNFTIDGVYQSWDSANETYTDWMIGAGVKFGGLKVNALYQKPDEDMGVDVDIYGLGAAYTFGNNTISLLRGCEAQVLISPEIGLTRGGLRAAFFVGAPGRAHSLGGGSLLLVKSRLFINGEK
ncbi:MAG: porin, partial [Halothiobacillus sp.]|nr:porin [Halothiobacillus sp.]